MRKRVAFIGTGGTIASIGKGPLDTVNYGANGRMLQADGILERFPEVQLVADVFAVPYRNVPSPQIAWKEWQELVLLCDKVAAETPDLAGIVIGHGTASLEETAFFLSLTLKVKVPVVVVGSQRPASALSTDAGLNLVNAVRVAVDEGARGLGALVLLNDEIQAAREVTKTSTGRMQTFRSPDFGVLGQADGDRVVWYRRPLRKLAPETEFDIRRLAELPRVDIAYSYAGADGTAVRAFTAAGAKGIVVAGFAPGFVTPGDAAALLEAKQMGVIVLQSTRAGSGRVFPTTKLAEAGFIPADNLNPQKARILLALALTISGDPAEIARIFATY
ncbi:asparaginase [Siccirubricoccus phaeus]|uniref:asparaginase n=1 Tax=Siccirubricoccus phaeus TaxID=2595053 RepID=UPI0011F0EF7B|nr:asparaginase [Siccirubricoccus phaeus]